jgi:hypothetical protein
METGQSDMKRLEEDIALIKKAIQANNGFIRKILAAPTLGSFYLVMGLTCTVLSLLWWYFVDAYGSFALVPTSIRIILLLVVIIVFILLSWWKYKSFSNIARTIDSRAFASSLVMQLIGHPVFYMQFVVLAGMVSFAIIALSKGADQVAVSVIAFGMALIYSHYLVAFLLYEYVPMIIWLVGLAVVAVFLPAISPLFLVAIGFGGGFIWYGLYCIMKKGKQ